MRIIAPDVGGGFGYKGILLPEEVCLGWLAMQLRASGALDRGPARASDRQRQLPRALLRHHRLCRPRRPADRDRLRGDGRFRRLFVLSVLGVPRGGAGRRASCPDRIDFPGYRCRTYSVATNKCPILPYRGVARTGVCFALELVLDAIAREAGIEPHEVRLRNLVPPGADAVRQHHQQAFRQRRLSASRCAARWRRSTSRGRGRARSGASRMGG